MNFVNKAVIAVAASFVLIVGLSQPAFAHVVYEKEAAWEDGGGRCLNTRSEISHGTGPGYSKTQVDMEETDAYNGFGVIPSIVIQCGKYWIRPAGEIRAATNLYKKTGASSYSLCNYVSYSYTGVQSFKLDQQKYWPYADMCGPGVYLTKSFGSFWWSSAWQGLPVKSGDHVNLGYETYPGLPGGGPGYLIDIV
jgi:hypothetical protein